MPLAKSQRWRSCRPRYLEQMSAEAMQTDITWRTILHKKFIAACAPLINKFIVFRRR